MAGMIESYKKVFENKNVHWGIYAAVFVWLLLSNILDAKTGKFLTYKQNPVDWVFNIIFGMYSLQFLNNAIKYDYSLPYFKEINWKAIWGMFGLNIVWGLYFVLGLIVLFVSYLLTHSFVLPIVFGLGLIFLMPFGYYLYFAYAEDFKLDGLLNIKLIFKFIKPSIKVVYLNFFKFFGFTAAAFVLYIILYTVVSFAGIVSFGKITPDFTIVDAFLFAVFGYFMLVTWFLAFPYSLVNSYKNDIRPIIKEGKDE